MVREESLSLGTDENVRAFARMFLNLAVGRAIYIPKLMPAEIKRIEKGGSKPASTETRIVRGKDRIGVSFFAKDVAGALQFWNLILSSSGQITKAEVKEY